jgi:hypothetical protein
VRDGDGLDLRARMARRAKLLVDLRRVGEEGRARLVVVSLEDALVEIRLRLVVPAQVGDPQRSRSGLVREETGRSASQGLPRAAQPRAAPLRDTLLSVDLFLAAKVLNFFGATD